MSNEAALVGNQCSSEAPQSSATASGSIGASTSAASSTSGSVFTSDLLLTREQVRALGVPDHQARFSRRFVLAVFDIEP